MTAHIFTILVTLATLGVKVFGQQAAANQTSFGLGSVGGTFGINFDIEANGSISGYLGRRSRSVKQIGDAVKLVKDPSDVTKQTKAINNSPVAPVNLVNSFRGDTAVNGAGHRGRHGHGGGGGGCGDWDQSTTTVSPTVAPTVTPTVGPTVAPTVRPTTGTSIPDPRAG